jgi:steroid 5-alpha reductase family enzyme
MAQLGACLARVDSALALAACARAAWLHPNPAAVIFTIALAAAAAAYSLSVATGRYSWVDKSWSILPAAYVGLLAARPAGDAPHPRLLLMAALAAIWGARLTYNFARKGGYEWEAQDYRWPVIAAYCRVFGLPGRIAYELFNLLFTALYQNLLLALLAAPAYAAWAAVHDARGRLAAPLGPLDAVAAALCAAALVLEAIADNQQLAFQTDKWERIATRRPLSDDAARGFLTAGLFRFSRHPNFFAEQAFWWCMCLFATAATGRWVGWHLAGAAALSALFLGSTWLTEALTRAKHPAYAEYQRTTNKFLPWWPAAAAPAARGRARAAASPTARKAPPAAPRARSKSRDAAPTKAAAKRAAPAAAKKSPAAAKEAGAAPAARRSTRSSA